MQKLQLPQARSLLFVTRLSFITFCCYIFLLTSCRPKSQTLTNATTQIEWVKKTWDFGDITAGEEVTHTFRFKNTGENNLLIKKIETGCGCTTVIYDKKPIAPGKEGKIEIAFNSAGRYGKQYKEISIFANIPEKQVNLSFIANVKK